MLYSEIIAVCSQIHTKHINTLCGQNVELCNVKLCHAQYEFQFPYITLQKEAVQKAVLQFLTTDEGS